MLPRSTRTVLLCDASRFSRSNCDWYLRCSGSTCKGVRCYQPAVFEPTTPNEHADLEQVTEPD
jgi:hypothetical protein